MAHHGLGHDEEAGKALADARQTMDTQSPEEEGGGFWHDWLRCQIILREAEAMIENDEQRPGAGDQGPANPGP
jgi:hypothetical protein